MAEQDKKPVDAENLSDEELEEIAGGVIRNPEKQKAERAEFLKNGGTEREWFIHTLRQSIKK